MTPKWCRYGFWSEDGNTLYGTKSFNGDYPVLWSKHQGVKFTRKKKY